MPVQMCSFFLSFIYEFDIERGEYHHPDNGNGDNRPNSDQERRERHNKCVYDFNHRSNSSRV